MDRISVPAGRVQRPTTPEQLSTRESLAHQQQHQTSHAQDAHDTRMDQTQTDHETRHITATPRGAGIVGDASDPELKTPSASSTGPGSLDMTAVSAPGYPHDLQSELIFRDSASESGSMFLLVLAKFAAFTDVFLSGLIIPLIPTILQSRAHVPHQQVQIWTSVLVSAYGGAFAVVSPLMPLLTRQGLTGYAVLFAGFGCAAAALAILHFSGNLSLLIFARALQGLAAAAITGSSSGLLATAAGSCLTWLTPAFIQSAAMATAPFTAGFLHDKYSSDAVFYTAYGLVALNMLLSIVAVSAKSTRQASHPAETAALLGPESPRGGYGTMPSATGRFSETSSRSVSPTSTAVRPSQEGGSPGFAAATPWSPRLLVAFCGYSVVGLLVSALQSVLPLYVQRRFDWSVLASGHAFVALSAPAAVVGLLSGTLAARVPKSTRFLTSAGFLACVPAFLYLGQLRHSTNFVQHAFLLTLSGISLATGLCGDPLVKEIAAALGSSGSDFWSAAAQATALPNLANAWGTLAGPLFAGAASWLYGWQTMNQLLAVVAAGAGVACLLFLQGWIGSPYSDARSGRLEAYDEESAPLLANDRSIQDPYGPAEPYDGKPEHCYTRKDSDEVSPHTRIDSDRNERRHRRHFSVDNFSVATTTAGSMDSSSSSVRFQAALETPLQGNAAAKSRRSESRDSASKANTERRYVMREAPHTPATDPLLAAGSLYVIDEERDTAAGGIARERQKRRVVVFPEGSAPPGLLERHRHHVVAINALDRTAQMVSESTDNHAVHVTEEAAADEAVFSDTTSRRYVVVVVEGEDVESV